MSTKKEAYEKLRAARRYPTESFSEVVLRASWAEDTLTARGLLDRHRKGPHFTAEEIDRVLRCAQRAADEVAHLLPSDRIDLNLNFLRVGEKLRVLHGLVKCLP